MDRFIGRFPNSIALNRSIKKKGVSIRGAPVNDRAKTIPKSSGLGKNLCRKIAIKNGNDSGIPILAIKAMSPFEELR